MYKIGEVANMLNVEKVIIFEKLISKAKEIEPYITKEKGITYFSDFAVEVMNALIYGGPMPKEQIEVEPEDSDQVSEHLGAEENDYISNDDIKNINDERARIKKEIMACRNKLIELDGQHKQIDEIIQHYHSMLKEDMDYIRIAENKLTYRMDQVLKRG